MLDRPTKNDIWPGSRLSPGISARPSSRGTLGVCAKPKWISICHKRLPEEFAKLQVEINDEKSRRVDLERGENFGFLGFDFRYLRSLRGVMRPHYTPKLKKRTALTAAIPDDLLVREIPGRGAIEAHRYNLSGRQASVAASVGSQRGYRPTAKERKQIVAEAAFAANRSTSFDCGGAGHR